MLTTARPAGAYRLNVASMSGDCARPPPAGPAVAVQPAEEVVAEIGEQGRREADQEEDRGPAAGPATDNPGMEVGRVDEPRDERSGLLRIPAPVAAPGHVRPERPEDEDGSHEREADDDRLVADLVEDGRFRQAPARAGGLEEKEERRTERDRE